MPQRVARPPLEKRLPVRLLRALDGFVARTYHGLRVRRPCTLPARGQAILVCNHTSGLDPGLIQAACRRMIVWMMASEYYNIRWLKAVFQTLETIPVDRRGRDMAATRAAMRALAHGDVLGVFPEGTFDDQRRDLLPFQNGVALLAIKTGAPVIPAYLDGTQRGKGVIKAVLTPNRSVITFGPAVEFDRSASSRDILEAATAKIYAAVAALKAECETPHELREFWVSPDENRRQKR